MKRTTIIQCIILIIGLSIPISMIVFNEEMNYRNIHYDVKKAVIVTEIYKEEFSGRVLNHIFYTRLKNLDNKEFLVNSRYCANCRIGDSVIYVARVAESKNASNLDMFEINSCSIIYKNRK